MLSYHVENVSSRGTLDQVLLGILVAVGTSRAGADEEGRREVVAQNRRPISPSC